MHYPKIATLLKRKVDNVANRKHKINKTETLTYPQELEKSSVAFTSSEPYLKYPLQGSSELEVTEIDVLNIEGNVSGEMPMKEEQKADYDCTNTSVFSKPYFMEPIQVLEIDDFNIEENVLGEMHMKEDQKTVYDCTSTFVFSKPYLMEPMQALESATNGNKNVLDQTNIDITLSKRVCFENEPITTINSELTQDIIPIEGKNPCKKDCIVKEANCETIANSENLDLKNENLSEYVIKKDDCKYCCIFSKAGRCDHCKKYMDGNIVTCAANKVFIKDLNEATSEVLEKTNKSKINIAPINSTTAFTINNDNLPLTLSIDFSNI